MLSLLQRLPHMSFAAVLQRRSRRFLILAVLGITMFLLTSGAFLHPRSARQLKGLSYYANSFMPDALSVQFSNSVEREAARIPRLLLSRSLIGIDPAYAEHELAKDKEQHDGYNNTVDPRSGHSPADAFAKLVVAQPQPAELAQQYAGEHCIARYPLQHCPFPGVCPPGAGAGEMPCAEWGTGRPASLRRWLDAGGLARNSTARAAPREWDRPGRWIGDLWHPYGGLRSPLEGEEYHFFTPEEMHQCFKGKRIVFQGDSMVRQLFSRVVQYLRLKPTHCEHVFTWVTATYQAFPNGTDHFVPDCPYRECTFPGNELYTIIFDWNDEKQPKEDIKRFEKLGADIVVQAIVYWIGSNIPLDDMRDALDEMFREGTYKWQYSWYLSPEKTVDWEDQYDERNAYFRKFLNDWKKKGRTDINLVPTDRVVRTNNGRPIVRDRRPVDSEYDDVHFMCDYINTDLKHPIKPGLQNLKAPMDWDARDMVTFNVMQLWLNAICDPSS